MINFKKENQNGINRPIFYRRTTIWNLIFNCRNAIIAFGALFFTWLGYYFGDVPCIFYKIYFA